MKVRAIKFISLICIMILLNCASKTAVCRNNQENRINDGAVILFSEYQFIIKFSNLIYEKNGKQLRIPVFQGNMGDAAYIDFLYYCYNNNILDREYTENSFIIEAEKGKLTKTFRDFLIFYKGNILKNTDIAQPDKIVYDGGALELYYDFQVDGVPFVLQVNISTNRKEINPGSIKSILDINLDENMKTPMFGYRFWKNKTTDEF